MDYDNWFISPPFSLSVGNEYNVQYFYRPLIGGNSESMTLYWGTSPFIEDLTNVLYEDTDFSGDWEEANARIIPDSDQIIYLGFHLNGSMGYGGFIDDITLSDWGTVGIGDNLDSKIIITNKPGYIMINSSEIWNGADVIVTNLMGQKVYSGNINSNSTQISVDNKLGLHLVSVMKDGNIVTRKLLIK